jgi:hypothetical protein
MDCLLVVLDAEVTPAPANDDDKERMSNAMDQLLDKLARKLAAAGSTLAARILAQCRIDTEWWDDDFRVMVYAPWSILLEQDGMRVADVIQHVQTFIGLQMELGLWDAVAIHGHVFEFTLEVVEYEET